MKSYILLEDIEIYAYHGVFAQETQVGNNFVVNVRMKVDIAEAAETDDLDKTIHYGIAYEVIKREMSIPSKLIEHAAGRILRSLKSEFPQIEEIELKLSKKNPPVGGQVESASIVLID